MMDLTSEEAAAVVGGRWLSPPPEGALRGVGIDSRESLDGFLFVAIRGERLDGHDFLADAFVHRARAALIERPLAQTPGPCLLVPSTRAALTALARHTRECFTGRAAAVTGSCGKTTTRRLIASILEQIGPTVQSPRSFNNDLGVPLTILALRSHHRHLVAEVGMNAPGEIEPLVRLVRPHVSVITMIGHAHLERLGSVEAIAREKASIVTGLEPDGTVVLPAASELATHAVNEALEHHGRCASTPRLTFGLRQGDARLLSRSAGPAGDDIEIAGPWGVLHLRLALSGEHNAMNAVAAAAAAHALGANADAIRDGLMAVRPSEMRFVRESLGRFTLLNDAYNANPEAMRASITAFAEIERGATRRVTLLGEMLELGAQSHALHESLGTWLASAMAGAPPDLAIFVGEGSAPMAESFHRAAPGAPLVRLPDTSSASVETLLAALRPGDSVLVKASRGAALEKLIAGLREECQASATASGGGSSSGVRRK
ncbi:MAG: UDP-N-acetylmuramoyl-tripeptide--D-alanyl-D-alanine ligase [Phycisphaeraceae bacterium]|nr:UDP-N-acetylmuramoyl-tripeptide--D-alanyl-D-alanine ligase [Phycisphaeraceae bacterium]